MPTTNKIIEKILLEKYFLLKSHNIKEINNIFNDIADKEKKYIYCNKKCYFCCNAYLIGSNIEAELIAYYLNENDFLYNNFIINLKKWKKETEKIKNIINQINKLIPVVGKTDKNVSLNNNDYENELKKYYYLMNFYVSKNIFCPFLYKKECSIYDARPYVCINLISFTESKFCENNLKNREIFRTQIPPVVIPVNGKVEFVPIVFFCIEKLGIDNL
ncbi:MAG: hypothetical protein KA792_05880 [Bacteroidales bacterium]|nr:hypothetical protein [Bacteroidales bacterium]